ncbi:MAG: hypothetical protein WA131_08300 [Desulfitobacteriaceae bacterium]
MNYSQAFISLEFNEEDSDLWGALQLIEPEKRSAFIKGALRCTLVAGLSPDCFYSEGASHLIENLRNNSLAMSKSSEEEFIQDSLNELAVQENSSSNNNQAPWEHLLYNIIGVEEDEAILNALNKTNTSHRMLNEVSLSTEDSSGEELNLMDNANPNPMLQDFNLEDLKVNTATVQSIGVEYVLKQVIGEETDAVIIELLQTGEPLTSI